MARGQGLGPRQASMAFDWESDAAFALSPGLAAVAATAAAAEPARSARGSDGARGCWERHAA